MRLDQAEIVEPEPGGGERPLPGELRPLEGDDVALAHRQEIVDLLGGAEHHRLVSGERGLDVGQHDRRGAVGDQRAIGALQRAGDQRVLVRDGAAEFVAEILLHLRQRVGDAVLVVLGGDARQRVGLVAVALEIGLGDVAEDAGEAALDRVLLLADRRR